MEKEQPLKILIAGPTRNACEEYAMKLLPSFKKKNDLLKKFSYCYNQESSVGHYEQQPF